MEDLAKVVQEGKIDMIVKGIQIIVFTCLVFSPCLDTTGQDALSRFKEFAVESAVFDLPCVIHFDISLGTESTLKDSVDHVRLVGRHVKLDQNRFRNDLVRYDTSPTGESREHQLFLQLSDREKHWAYRWKHPGDNDVQKGTIVGLTGDSASIKRCNPFAFLLSGPLELQRPSWQGETLDGFTSNYVTLSESEEYVKHVKAALVLQFEFDKEDTWRILRMRGLCPGGDPYTARRTKKKVTTVEDLKEFSASVAGEAKWRELENGIKVPFWVHYRTEKLAASDPSEIQEMEAFFFGFRLEANNTEPLFDPKRINNAHWSEDFRIHDIESLGKSERQKYLAR